MNGNQRMYIPGVVFGKNPEYYDSVQKQHPEDGFFVCWNWAAAFLQIFWLIWRRSYLGALIMAILTYIATFIFSFVLGLIAPEAIALNSFLSYFIPFALYGALGNSVYLKFISDKIIKKKQSGKTDQEILDKCTPSFVPVLIYFGIVFLSGILIGFIIGGLILSLFAFV